MMIMLNGKPAATPAGSTLADLVTAMQLPGRGIALAVDGEVVHRHAWPATHLTEQSRVEVVTAMQGG